MAHERYVGNGTTALTAALVGLGCEARGGLVALPATVCPSVVAAIFASGKRPYFVDIEGESMGLCPERLAAIDAPLAAVVAVHAFGTPCRIGELAQVCRQRGVALIEDCAQAEGATADGQPVGSSGDVAIFSYGAGKILDLGGGGRLVTRDDALAARVDAFAASLPEHADEQAAGDLGHIYKLFYNRCYPQRLEPFRYIFARLFAEAGVRMLGGLATAQRTRIDSARARLDEVVAARRRKHALYAELLASRRELTLLPLRPGAVPWRFDLWLEPPVRERVLRAMLAERRNVSSWYPDITPFLGRDEHPCTPLPVSEWLSGGVLNLWLDEQTDEAEIHATCRRLCELLDGSASRS